MLLAVIATFVIVIFPPILPVALAVLFILRRRRGELRLPLLPFLSRAGRVVFFGFAWLGLLLVTIEFVASSYFNAVDEHVAPVVAVFVLFGLWLIVTADVVVGLARTARPRRRAR